MSFHRVLFVFLVGAGTRRILDDTLGREVSVIVFSVLFAIMLALHVRAWLLKRYRIVRVTD